MKKWIKDYIDTKASSRPTETKEKVKSFTPKHKDGEVVPKAERSQKENKEEKELTQYGN